MQSFLTFSSSRSLLSISIIRFRRMIDDRSILLSRQWNISLHTHTNQISHQMRTKYVRDHCEKWRNIFIVVNNSKFDGNTMFSFNSHCLFYSDDKRRRDRITQEEKEEEGRERRRRKNNIRACTHKHPMRENTIE